MYNIIIGSLLISLLHAVIPNHWLPVLAIGRKEQWTLAETSRVTLIAGIAHVISTVLIGLILGLIGSELTEHIEHFTRYIAPAILILMGVYFIRQHYTHHHFHVQPELIKKKSKKAIITALVFAMFLSPCMEIEAYFLLAGTKSWYLLAGVGLMYSVITIAGMLIWIRIVYKGLLKLNWHKWEHNAGIITGLILIITGLLSFFIS
jgi:nickel/cobalt transporter (NicO) family protein